MRLRGQSTTEYGLLIALITIIALLGANAFGKAIFEWFAALATRLTAS